LGLEIPGRIDRVDDAGWVDVFGQHGDETPAQVTAHLNDSAHKHCIEDGIESREIKNQKGEKQRVCVEATSAVN
jgi:hypothetical protein